DRKAAQLHEAERAGLREPREAAAAADDDGALLRQGPERRINGPLEGMAEIMERRLLILAQGGDHRGMERQADQQAAGRGEGALRATGADQRRNPLRQSPARFQRDAEALLLPRDAVEIL